MFTLWISIFHTLPFHDTRVSFRKASSDDFVIDLSFSKTNRTAERLMKDYGTTIYRYAYSFMHNKEDAEDVLQDTLIQYIKTSVNFQNPSHEKAWLLKVAGNISKNKLQSIKIRSHDELHDNLTKEDSPDLLFVWDAVKQLPIKYREVIHLYYYEQLSTADIANVLQKKESTVRSLLKRGREQLKDILKEVYDFE